MISTKNVDLHIQILETSDFLKTVQEMQGQFVFSEGVLISMSQRWVQWLQADPLILSLCPIISLAPFRANFLLLK